MNDPGILWLLAFAIGCVAYWLGRWRRDKAIELSDKALLNNWLAHAAAFTPQDEIHQHIIKHANELTGEYGTRESWSASMHNLLSIYDKAHGVFPDDELRLARMTAKYLENPDKNTAPPSPLPERVAQRATRKWYEPQHGGS
jgi:hypothetical protein